jgi:hypothetical protein
MQIASSTRHQSLGVESIWQATTEIDRIANETAQGIHQIEAAAANLKALSAAMAEIVGRYRIRRVKPRPETELAHEEEEELEPQPQPLDDKNGH